MMKPTSTPQEAREYADELDAEHTAARHAFAAVLASDAFVGHEEIANGAVRIAELEGAAYAAARYADARVTLEHDGAVLELMRELLHSPRDTWSGRSNDVRRARHDGFRQTVARFARGF